MGHLQIEKLRAAKLETDPFEYVVVPAFLNAASLKRINTTFPAIAKGGSYPIGYHPAMSKKKEALEAFRHAYHRKPRDSP
jgi:hypothetical protein